MLERWDIPASSPTRPSRISHVRLDGGRIDVPRTDRGAFLAAYADAVLSASSGAQLHWVERTLRDERYRMFADFDVPLGDGQMLHPTADVLCIVMRALACLPEEMRVGPHESIAVCTRRASDEKVGAHLVWHDLRVDDSEAMRLRNLWVAACERQDAALADGRWDATIDAAVYRKNGLRMPWSRKRGDRDGSGVYIPSHVYLPARTKLSPLPTPPRTREDVIAQLEITVLYPSSSSSSASASMHQMHQMQPMNHHQPVHHVSVSSSSSSAMVDAAAREISHRWPGARVRECSSSESDVVILSCDDRRCEIAGRAHRSNHIFFELQRSRDSRDSRDSKNKWRIFQRCHAEACCGGRVYVCDLAAPRTAEQTSLDRVHQRRPESEVAAAAFDVLMNKLFPSAALA